MAANGSHSNYLESLFLNHYYRGVVPTLPANLYIGLVTTAPSDSASGTEVSTSNWTNYARQALARATGTFSASSGGSAIASAADIDFGTAATTGDISIAGFVIWDASSGGNAWDYYEFAAPQIVQNGNPVKFVAGQLTIAEN